MTEETRERELYSFNSTRPPTFFLKFKCRLAEEEELLPEPLRLIIHRPLLVLSSSISISSIVTTT